MMGDQLLNQISEATGLPKNLVADELQRLLTAAGKEPSQTNLDDLRAILTDYVQEILVKAKTEYGAS